MRSVAMKRIWLNHWFSTAYFIINMMRENNPEFQFIASNENQDSPIMKASDEWYQDITKPAISLTLPKSQKVYESPKFFSFFDGLIPEGYLFQEVIRHWNIPTHDRFGILLKSGADCIGAVTLEEVEE